MDAATLGNLVQWNLQLALIAGAAAVLVRVLDVSAPSIRYAFWRAVLFACLALPLVQPWHAPASNVSQAVEIAVPAATDEPDLDGATGRASLLAGVSRHVRRNWQTYVTGIVAELPAALAQFFTQGRTGALSPAVIVGVMVMVVAVVGFVVFMERALRKIHIQYPKRQVGMKIYGGESSNLPVKINPSGVIPAIFASSLLLLPATITTFAGSPDAAASGIWSYIAAYMGRGQPVHMLVFGLMIVFFTYFYTANVAFKSEIVAVSGEIGIARWSASLTSAASGARVELDGVFVLKFDAGGLCSELREWWHVRAS